LDLSICEEVGFGITFVVAILPVLAGFCAIIVPLELIAPAADDEDHADGSEGGRDDKDQYPTAQSLNHSRPGGSPLRIAESAILGEGRKRQCQEQRNRR
jgi:hypothetical protein